MWKYARAALAVVCASAALGGCDIVEGRRPPEEVSFSTHFNVVLANLEGSEPSPLPMRVQEPGFQEQRTLLVYSYAWSPDGRTLALAGHGGYTICWSTGCPDLKLHTYDVATGEVHRLESIQGSVRALDWAPDGSRLLVAAAPSGAFADGRQMRLLLVDPGTGAADTLGFEPRSYGQVRWSPEGSRFAAVSSVPQVGRIVTLMTVQGSESDPVLTSDQHLRVDWSPAGDRLLVAEPRAASQLYSLHLASGTRTDIDLPEPMRFIEDARWSQDGQGILFAGIAEAAPADRFTTNVYLLREGPPLLDLGEGHRPAWRPRR